MFNTMKINVQTLVSSLRHYFTKVVIGCSILTVIWQGIMIGIDPAIAAPLLATSADSISKQVTGKAEEMKGSTTRSIGKAQSTIEDKASSAKMKVKDDLTEAKIKINSNNTRVKNTADKATSKVKNFFGK
jgi:uncharacterized protein YjbJ (UPF0337 family)